MAELTFQNLRAINIQRCMRWHGNKGLQEWSLSDWFTATVGELGEAGNIIKKLNRDRDGLPGNTKETHDQLLPMLEKEIADTMIYLDLLAARAGINLEKAVIEKFNEVSERNSFPERL